MATKIRATKNPRVLLKITLHHQLKKARVINNPIAQKLKRQVVPYQKSRQKSGQIRLQRLKNVQKIKHRSIR